MVSIEGRHFFMEIDEAVQWCGFYTARFVEAVNQSMAEREAHRLVHGDLAGRSLNPPNDPPTILTEEVVELVSFGDYAVPGSGFSWYLEEDEQGGNGGADS